MNVHQSSVLLAAAATLMAASSASATFAPNINVDGVLLGEPNITGVTTTMGTSAGNVSKLINQSDFAPPYVSLSTDFDSFLNSATTPANPIVNGWRSADGTTAGYVTFAFDQAYSITGIGLWQSNAVNVDRQLQNFAVYADSDANPNNGLGTLMGSFTAQQITTGSPFAGQAWGQPSDAWTAATTQFVHLNILSNYGATSTSLGEVAFATPTSTVVPEPITLLGAGAAAGMGAFFKRRQKKAN